MINVAMISGWHVHAKGYAREIMSVPDCAVTAIYDEIPERGKQWADEIGCKFVENYDDILSDSSVDAVAVCSPTNIHTDIIIKAAKAGKHIFTEKVLALTDAEAELIADAVKQSGVHFTISYPHKCRDTLQFAKEAASSGKLGKLTYARVRNCHSGSVDNWLPDHFYSREQCGGGAMVDLGAHPMYTLEWILGKPLSVRSLFTNITPHPVEDNAVCLLEFEGGAIGVSETGFVSRCDSYVLEVSGTEGAVRVIGDSVQYACVSETEKKWVDVTPENKYVPSPVTYWLDSIKNDTPNELFNIDEAVSLTALMDAAYRSFESGKAEKVRG